MRVGIFAGCAAAAALCAACGDGGTNVAANDGDGCPSEAEVHETFERYITTDYWDESERDVWNIANVDGFEFGEMRVGEITGSGPCPLRVEYSFVEHKEDGSANTVRMGDNQTFYFSKDAFGDWTFTTG